MKLSAARGRLKFSDNTTGAALMSGAALAFVLNDFLMKLVFAELSVVQGVRVRPRVQCRGGRSGRPWVRPSGPGWQQG
ncbi:MAG: hypothetical protein ACPGRU_03900, partial [Candidatus Puniceispirillaceae bacterium]